MKNIICISGDIGSGKSAVGKLLAAKLKFEYFSAGMLFRQLAAEKGVTVLELNRLSEREPAIDSSIDSRIVELSQTSSRVVFDSRMAWHFLKDALKVYLVVDDYEAARRLLASGRIDEGYASLEEACRAVRERQESECRRYLARYGVDITDIKNYDLIIDTNSKSIETVADMIIESI